MYYTLQMYEQLKTAYETEVDMIRGENEKKIRRSIANHALQLQNYRDEVSLKLKIFLILRIRLEGPRIN